MSLVELSPSWNPASFVHPLAQVDRDCSIGARTRVWQFASVIRKAHIGDDCSIATSSIVDGSRLGDRVIVSHGAFIDPGMEIGSDVFIGPHGCLCNDYWPRVTKEGWFDVDDLVSGKIVVTRILDGASIGAGAILMPGIRIGERAMVAAGAVVMGDVPDDMLYGRDSVCRPIRHDGPRRKRYVDYRA
jgi:UDP-2-acetamido-3-amino-2,3-dideoxy-glucuronate N-acetyltransferase